MQLCRLVSSFKEHLGQTDDADPEHLGQTGADSHRRSQSGYLGQTDADPHRRSQSGYLGLTMLIRSILDRLTTPIQSIFDRLTPIQIKKL